MRTDCGVIAARCRDTANSGRKFFDTWSRLVPSPRNESNLVSITVCNGPIGLDPVITDLILQVFGLSQLALGPLNAGLALYQNQLGAIPFWTS